MVKREARFTTKLVRWLKEHAHFSGPVEVKLAQPRRRGGDRLCRSQFKAHQLPALRLANDGCLAWKIPDAGWANPFDVIVYKDAPAYVCAVFEEKRFYLVPVGQMVALFQLGNCAGEAEVAEVAEVAATL